MSREVRELLPKPRRDHVFRPGARVHHIDEPKRPGTVQQVVNRASGQDCLVCWDTGFRGSETWVLAAYLDRQDDGGSP